MSIGRQKKKEEQSRNRQILTDRIKRISEIIIVDIFLFIFVNFIVPIVLVISRNVDFTSVTAELIVKATMIVVVMAIFDILLSLSFRIPNAVSESIRIHFSAYLILSVIGLYVYFFNYAQFFSDFNVYQKFALLSVFLLSQSLVVYALTYIAIITVLKIWRWY